MFESFLDKHPSLYITEIFSSVQGETSLTGLPTTFVRLAGCNLRCRWCDTTYSFSKGTKIPLSDIIKSVEEKGLTHVCITGGEPLLQKKARTLMSRLCDLGYHLILETGGSLPTDQVDSRVRIILDVKCPGSGMSHKNCWSNLDRLNNQDEVKFVIKDEEDYRFALNICEKYSLFSRGTEPLFSPVFGELDPKAIIAWILRDRVPARLNLQMHKYVWSPETRGV